jgi:hypothetical protein
MRKTTADPSRPSGDETRADLWIDSLAQAWQPAEAPGQNDFDEQAHWGENREMEVWMNWDIDHGKKDCHTAVAEAIIRRAKDACDRATEATTRPPVPSVTDDPRLPVPARPRSDQPRDVPSSGGLPWRPRPSVPLRPFEPRGRSSRVGNGRDLIAVFALLLLANSLLWFAAGLSIVAGAGTVGDPRFVLTSVTFLLGIVAGGLAATFFQMGTARVWARPVFSLAAEARLERLCGGRPCGRSRGAYRGR